MSEKSYRHKSRAEARCNALSFEHENNSAHRGFRECDCGALSGCLLASALNPLSVLLLPKGSTWGSFLED